MLVDTKHPRFAHTLRVLIGLTAVWSVGTDARGASDDATKQAAPLSDYTIHIMPQSHMDPVWRWRVYEGYDLIRDTFAQAIRFMDEREDFVFNQSSAWMHHQIEQRDPELFKAINQAARGGRWCVVGGSWVEADQNIPGGEAMVRQYLYGQRYFRERFGVTATVGWNVDAFGHAWTLPQIMAKSGVTYNVVTRCGPGEILFRWQGPDGSSVTTVDARALIDLAGKHLGGIKSPAQIFGIMPQLRKMLDEIGLKHLCGGTVVGDHGGGPTRREMAILDAISQMKKLPKIVLDRADRALTAMADSAGDLPVHADEMNYVFEGCYASQMEVKRRNRTDEHWLTTAEKAWALAAMLGATDYPRTELQQAWRHVLFNQFHDILPGTSIRRVYQDVDDDYDRAETILQDVTESALATIGRSLNTEGDGQAVVVTNSLAWPRTDLAWVILDYTYVPAQIEITDAGGNASAGQVVSRMRIYESFERCKIIFVARDVPPVGAKVFHVRALSGTGREMKPLDHFDVPITEELYKAYRPKGTYWKQAKLNQPGDGASLSARRDGLSSRRYAVTLDPATGHVTQVTDKKLERDLVPTGAAANRLDLMPESDGSDSWRLRPTGQVIPLDKPAGVRVVANGPVAATVEVRYARNGSIYEQRITLYDGLDRIDMTNQTEWRERNTALKVRWPIAPETDRWTREIPYGWIAKPMRGREVPAQRWVDVSGDDWGVSVLNDGRYGYDCKGGEVGITLLRSPTGPDPVADLGQHAVTYSLWPHEGALDPAAATRRATELNTPLMTRAVDAHGGTDTEVSLLQVAGDHTLITSVKQAYDGIGWIVRAVETRGEGGQVEITCALPLQAAEEVNLIEDRVGAATVDGNVLRFAIKPHEIKTFRVEVGG